MSKSSINLGYACINMTLAEQDSISCNRSMIKRTFLSKGLEYVSELAAINVHALQKILEWNVDNNINIYRMTSCMFPWFSEYEFDQLPNIEEIKNSLKSCGKYALDNGIRLSFHPGPFNCLGSPNEKTVDKTIYELNAHSKIMDFMGLPESNQSKINIHVGGSYGNHEAALSRFCNNFKRLDDATAKRLTVENDDRASLYSTKMLYKGVYEKVGIPIVFDSHHHELGPQDLDYHDAFYLARSTWPTGIRQQCHHSNSKRDYETTSARPQAHSDWYYTPFENYNEGCDVVLECKTKELGVLSYREKFLP